MGRTGTNQFVRNAKFDEATLMRLAYCFCQGIGLELAARSTGLSRKTARGTYLDLRTRLLKPAFNRWHGTNRRFLKLPSPEYEVLVRAAYFDTLARCAGNEICARNFRLGNRLRRQCRTCPLAGTASDERRSEAYTVIDTVHDFYERLGIRGEKDMPPVLLFRERLIHTTVVATVHNHSRTLANGFFDPVDRGFLSGGTLLDVLLTDLADDPL
jgi:hypothetical protein